MFNILKSYWIRTKRTPSRMVIILCPLLFTGLFIVYLLSSTSLKGVELAYFFGAYTILAGFSISFFIPMLYENDKKAGSYANDLRIGICRKKLFFAKYLFIFILLITIEGIALLPFLLFLYFHGIKIQISDLEVYTMIWSIGLISMVPFVYPIRLLYGYVCRSFNLNTIIFYLFLSFFISFVSVGICSFWYNQWDGISKMEE